MARVIGNDCIKCGNCEASCPVNAITEGEDMYIINAAVCIDCGACEAECPTSAITRA